MKTRPSHSGAPGNIVPLPTPEGQAGPAPAPPAKPETHYQQRQRAILAAVASHWRHLPPAFRPTWATLARQLPGDLSAFAAFNQVNATLLTLGHDLLEVAPEVPPFGRLHCGPFTVLHAPAAPHPLTLSLPVQNTRPPDDYLYKATRPLSPGVSNPGTAYRIIASAPGSAPLSPDQLTRAYLDRFGDPPDGEALFLCLTPVTQGLCGVSFTLSTLVTRAPAPAP